MAVIGATLAFVAQGLSPFRFALARDHFLGTKPGPLPEVETNTTGAALTATNFPLAPLSARLRQQGLQLAESNQVVQLFRDPRRGQDAVIFIDSRDAEHYRAGHIPGAYLFDRFRPEDYLTNVVSVCLAAQQIVFYCLGGDCDDSGHAALLLRDSLHLSNEKVFVYGGGMNEWAAGGMPIELGARNSGQFTNLAQSATAPGPGGTNR